MVGADIGAGVSAEAKIHVRTEISTKLEAAARLRAMAEARHMALVEANASAIIETLMDLGYVERDAGPASCTRCGREIFGERCVYCGAELGEQDPMTAPDPDEEINQAEEAAGAGDDADPDDEQGFVRDLPERLRDSLLDAGWSWEEAEGLGVWLCALWEEQLSRSAPKDAHAFEQCVHGKMNAEGREQADQVQTLLHTPNLLDALFAICRGFADESKTEPQTKPLTVIDIAFFRWRWKVTVEDPYKDNKLGRLGGQIQLSGGLWTNGEKFLEWHARKMTLLKKVGEFLLQEREGFFDARSQTEADAILTGQALEQKSVAEAIGASPSTVSRWCREDSGIHVRTPHGLYHLSAFFTQAARTHSLREHTVAMTFECILAVLSLYPPDDWPSNKDLRQRLDDECDQKIEERTLRRYLKMVRIWDAYRAWASGRELRHLDEESLGQFLTETHDSLPEKESKRFIRSIHALSELKGGDIWE